MERRLAAILAADVAGYSHLMEEDDEASTTTLQSYFDVVRESVVAHRGRVFSTAGDSIVAEFPSIVDAIRSAVEIQREILERNTAVSENKRMCFRIGVNLGDIISDHDSLYGTGVNVAARLEQLAEPGGICISQNAYDQVRKILEMSFEDIGEFRLKNIADPVRVYRISSTPWPRFSSRALRRGLRRSLRMAIPYFVVASVIVAALLTWQNTIPTGLGGFGSDATLSSGNAAIAVLPFEDISSNSDQEYLANGITEELVTGLAKFPDISVVGGSSTSGYKGKQQDPGLIGRQLRVTYVIEGTLQRANDTVRITAQLIETSSGRNVWAERYDRKLDNIFDIRDEIMRSVAGTLMGTRGKLAIAEVNRLSKKDPTSFTAYDYLMKGWFDWSEFTKEGNESARQFFEKSRSIDQNYARAYAGLAWTYSLDYDYDWTDDRSKTLAQMLQMAETAVRLDPDDYRSHWALGWAYLYNREFDEATAHYERARDLNPNDAELLAEMANLLIYIGQPQRAVNQLQEAIRLNPFHESWYVEYLGWAYQEAGMSLESIKTLEKVIDNNPGEEKLWILPTLAAAYADPRVDRKQDAAKIVKSILTLDPGFTLRHLRDKAPYKSADSMERRLRELRRAGLPE